MARNTTTGRVLEEMILPALAKGGYDFTEQAFVGEQVNGRKHKIDVLVESDILVSLKWQQSSGTAEQKVAFEIINLVHACTKYNFSKAYLVLGGIDSKSGDAQGGWTLRKWFLEGGMSEFVNYKQYVEILLPEEFVAKANRSHL